MVTVEIPRDSLQAEIRALGERAFGEGSAEDLAWAQGALQALLWIDQGAPKPSEAKGNRS